MSDSEETSVATAQAAAEATAAAAEAEAVAAPPGSPEQSAVENTETEQSGPMNGDGGFDIREFEQAGLPQETSAGAERLQRILRLEVPVIVKVAEKQLPLGDVINLSPGSIIEFSRSSDQPLELQVNNKIIGQGTAVKVGEKFGLRICRIAPVSEKIRSLGR